MTDNSDTFLAQLPTRLRDARRQQGLSLDAVSKLSGVSRAMVSQIERGECSPTILTCWNLTRALQVDFASLLDAGARADQIEVLRSETVPTIDNIGKNVKLRILSPPEAAGQHAVYGLIFGLDGVLDSQAHQRGTREHLTVIEGIVDVQSGNDKERLHAGDTARYGADVVHSVRAVGVAKTFLAVKGPRML